MSFRTGSAERGHALDDLWPKIRFYAGFPMRDSEQKAVGTFDIMPESDSRHPDD
jgi:hypothetical protein